MLRDQGGLAGPLPEAAVALIRLWAPRGPGAGVARRGGELGTPGVAGQVRMRAGLSRRAQCGPSRPRPTPVQPHVALSRPRQPFPSSPLLPWPPSSQPPTSPRPDPPFGLVGLFLARVPREAGRPARARRSPSSHSCVPSRPLPRPLFPPFGCRSGAQACALRAVWALPRLTAPRLGRRAPAPTGGPGGPPEISVSLTFF